MPIQPPDIFGSGVFVLRSWQQVAGTYYLVPLGRLRANQIAFVITIYAPVEFLPNHGASRGQELRLGFEPEYRSL